MVKLFLLSEEGRDFLCGGSLVAASVVITAAHCVVKDYEKNGKMKTEQKASDLMVCSIQSPES